MRDTGLRDERGAALIVVLLMVTVLVAITLEMSRAARSEYYETANLRDRLRTIYLAKSGFYLGQAVLAEDADSCDGLFEKWARPEILSARSASLFEDGYFRVEIEDESGRIPINRLAADGNSYQPVRDALANLLAQPEFNVDAGKADAIINAIKDYIDPDAVSTVPGSGTGEPGKENGDREPAGFKNKPLDSLEELLAIREITRELFYGTGDKPGISRYLTVYGEGRININTAPMPVLKALSLEISDDRARQMEDFRKNGSPDLADPGWYRKIAGLSGVNIQQDLITVKSRVFRITATGTLGPAGDGGRARLRSRAMTGTVTGVVERRDASDTGTPQGQMKVLSWKIE